MILFRCVTVYHLFNAINIKYNFLKDQEAILILSNDTDFRPLEANLRDSGIFKKIVFSSIKKDYSNSKIVYGDLNRKERFKASKCPEKFITECGGEEELACLKEENITDFYLALNYSFERMLYYAMIKNGMRPKVHLFEEGSASYVLNHFKLIESDGINHEYYKDKAFLYNITEMLCYEPSLVVSADSCFQINRLPKIHINNVELKDILKSVFGNLDLPEEKYIFFDKPDFAEKLPSMQLDLLDELSNILGKNNIIVKCHPRNNSDRYSIRGYKIIPANNMLWEMANFNQTITDKILISEISTSSITAKTIFDINVTSINVFNMTNLDRSFFVTQPSFKGFYDKYKEFINSKQLNVFTPSDLSEFNEIIVYLEGRKVANEC